MIQQEVSRNMLLNFAAKHNLSEDDILILDYFDSTITDYDVEQINQLILKNQNKTVFILLNSCKNLASSTLSKINTSGFVCLSDDYNRKMYASMKDMKVLNYENKEDLEDVHVGSTIYKIEEFVYIIKAMEKIEEGINEDWNTFEKIYYLYDSVAKSISYNHDFLSKKSNSYKDKSLRGLLSHKAICAGYSQILGQLLERQYISNQLVSGIDHVWNVVHVYGKNSNLKHYFIDVTMDSATYHKTGKTTYSNFMPHPTDFAQISEHLIDITNFDDIQNLKFSYLKKDDIDQLKQSTESYTLLKKYSKKATLGKENFENYLKN